MLTDPIADMLTRIRNANKALHETAQMPTSRAKEEIARLLKEEGYIRDYRIEKGESFDTVVVTRPSDRGEDRSLHGLTRTLIANMVEGVTKGFEKRLEIQGVGYRAALRGSDLELAVGFSHPVVIKPRAGISFEVPAPNQVVVKGIDKQAVGQTAAEVRKVRPPE